MVMNKKKWEKSRTCNIILEIHPPGTNVTPKETIQYE